MISGWRARRQGVVNGVLSYNPQTPAGGALAAAEAPPARCRGAGPPPRGAGASRGIQCRRSRGSFRSCTEALTGEKTPGQIAKAYGVHPNTVGLWKKRFIERGPELFAEDTAVKEYERRIAELEQLLGKKEVEIALLENFLRRSE